MSLRDTATLIIVPFDKEDIISATNPHQVFSALIGGGGFPGTTPEALEAGSGGLGGSVSVSDQANLVIDAEVESYLNHVRIYSGAFIGPAAQARSAGLPITYSQTGGHVVVRSNAVTSGSIIGGGMIQTESTSDRGNSGGKIAVTGGELEIHQSNAIGTSIGGGSTAGAAAGGDGGEILFGGDALVTLDRPLQDGDVGYLGAGAVLGGGAGIESGIGGDGAELRIIDHAKVNVMAETLLGGALIGGGAGVERGGNGGKLTVGGGARLVAETNGERVIGPVIGGGVLISAVESPPAHGGNGAAVEILDDSFVSVRLSTPGSSSAAIGGAGTLSDKGFGGDGGQLSVAGSAQLSVARGGSETAPAIGGASGRS